MSLSATLMQLHRENWNHEYTTYDSLVEYVLQSAKAGMCEYYVTFDEQPEREIQEVRDRLLKDGVHTEWYGGARDTLELSF